MELLVVLVLAPPAMEPKRLPRARRDPAKAFANSVARPHGPGEPLPPPSPAEQANHS
jgi:hypothetical protein